MKNIKITLSSLLFALLLFTSCEVKNEVKTLRSSFVDNTSFNIDNESIVNDDSDSKKIQVALLLDTSNSMDGLIEQAKTRLWTIVNTLTTLKYEGDSPDIEISLYEYGNDGIDENNFIRQVTPLTQDLDLISEKLFALRTNGGSEYCGAVIAKANSNLEWKTKDAMKLIYIAGNEPFTQGNISYKEAISDAKESKIYINTIFCGDWDEGVKTNWKDGAERGNGKYFNIDSDKEIIFIETPYDDDIQLYNQQLNDTYIGYGEYGRAKKQNQIMQDSNASSISKENSVNRTISKSKRKAYKNTSWDLVDKEEAEPESILKIKEEDLPEELKNKTDIEKKEFVEELKRKRAEAQKGIAVLSIKRQEFIDTEMKKRAGNEGGDDLGTAIEKSIFEIAKIEGFKK